MAARCPRSVWGLTSSPPASTSLLRFARGLPATLRDAPIQRWGGGAWEGPSAPLWGGDLPNDKENDHAAVHRTVGRLGAPEVWITLGGLDRPEADSITLTVRIKEINKRSISATVPVTRYAPTSSVVLAASKCIEALGVAQCKLDKTMLQEQLAAAVRSWVDPF